MRSNIPRPVLRVSSVVSLLSLLVVLGLRRQEILADSLAIVLLAVLAIVFAASTTALGVHAARSSGRVDRS